MELTLPLIASNNIAILVVLILLGLILSPPPLVTHPIQLANMNNIRQRSFRLYLYFCICFLLFIFFVNPYGYTNYLAAAPFLLISACTLIRSLQLKKKLPSNINQNFISDSYYTTDTPLFLRKLADLPGSIKSSTTALFNFIFAVTILLWFTKEYTGSYPPQPFDFLFNLSIVFLILLSLYINLPNKPYREMSLLRSISGLITWKNDKCLFVLIMMFLALMSTFFFWDFPYQYHPGDDEFIIPSMYFSQGDLGAAITNPNGSQNPIYDNQHLMYYILAPLFSLLRVLFSITPFEQYIQENEVGTYFLFARFINICFAVGIIVLTYTIGKLVVNKTAAIAMAVFLSSSKLLQYWALFVRPDIILTFFITFLLFLIVLSVVKKYRNYLLYGLIIGLGMSLKPYALMFSLPVIFLLLYDICTDRNVQINQNIRDGALVLSGIFAAFYFGRFYPYIFAIELNTGINESVEHSTTGHYGLYPTALLSNYADKLQFSFTTVKWWWSTPFIIAALAGTALALFIKENRFLVLTLLGTLVLSYNIYANQIYQTGKFYLTISPLLAFFAGVLVHCLIKRLPTIITPLFTFLLILAITINPLYLSVAKASLLWKQDIRTSTRDWFKSNTPKGTSVSILGNVSWQRPPLDRTHNPIVNGYSTYPDYLVVPQSSYNTIMFYLRNQEMYKSTDWFPSVEPTEEEKRIARHLLKDLPFFNLRGVRYKLITEIHKEQTFFGYPYNEYFDHPSSWDIWAVTNPKPILIYRRVD